MRKRWTEREAEHFLPPGVFDWVQTDVEPVTTHYRSIEHWWQSSWSQAPAIAWQNIPPELQTDASRASFGILSGIQARDGSLERTRAVGFTVAQLPD
jgi:hypothetical protein